MKKIIQTRDQIRAQMVFEHIKELENSEKLGKEYGTLANSAPTLIRSAGLMQFLAFYKAKDKNHHRKYLNYLSNELIQMEVMPVNTDLFNYVMNCNLPNYIRLTKEILALSQWHKRFAQSVLKVESGGN